MPRCLDEGKNGSVVPQPKQLLHFHRQCLRCFVLIYHYFTRHGPNLRAPLVSCILLLVLRAHVVCFLRKNGKVYVPLVPCILVGSFGSAAIILR